MNSPKVGLGTAALQKITPGCVNIVKTVKMVSILTLILTLIAATLLIIAIIYNYARKTDSSDADEQTRNEESKRKMIGALASIGTAFIGVAALFAVWGYSVLSKAVKTCITKEE